VLFGFIYPADQRSIPAWVYLELSQRLRRELAGASHGDQVCGGTLLSREQFLIDIHDWGYVDGRLATGAMNEREIAGWTAAIDHEKPAYEHPHPRPR
jgi:hypothetical protein